MGKAAVAFAFLALLVLLAVSAGCDGGGGPPTTATATAAGSATSTTTTGVADIDIKDFDTARFTMTQTSTSGGETSQLTGEGVIDNRKQAVTLTYQGGPGGQTIAIGRTIYTYDEGTRSWASFTEPADGQVGFGRPYWPQFWLDATQIEELGGQSLQGGEANGYRLTFDLAEAGQRLGDPEATEPLDVRQAEVEVWVDSESRYALQLTFRLQVSFGETSVDLEITSIFSDFGAEVQIEAPTVASPTSAAPTPAPTGP